MVNYYKNDRHICYQNILENLFLNEVVCRKILCKKLKLFTESC